MEIQDYSKRLAQAKTNYNESANELRETYNKDLQDLRDTHEARSKKQSDVFKNAKLDLEQQQADYISEYDTKTKEAIEDQTRKFRNDLKSERDNFNSDRNKIKGDFSRRFNELSDTYDTREKERQQYSDHRLKTTENRYNNQVSRLNDQFQEDIHQMNTNANRTLKMQQDEQNNEKRNIINKHNLDMRKVVKSDNLEKAKILENQAKAIQNLRTTQSAEIEQLKDYHARSADDIRAVKNKEKDDLQTSFKELTGEISKRNQQKRVQEMKEADELKQNIQKTFANDLYTAKREMAEKLKSGGQVEHANQKLDQTVKSYEDRIENIYEKESNVKYLQHQDKEKIARNAQDTIRDLKYKNQLKIEDKDKELRDFKLNELKQVRDKSELAIDEFRKESKKSEIRNEAQLLKERDHSNKVLTNQRKSFGETINSITRKNQEALSEVQELHAKEKTAFIEKTRKEHHRDIEEVKMSLKHTMAEKEKSLMERNEQLKKINERLEAQYENKITVLEKNNHRTVEKLKLMHAEEVDQLRLATKRLIQTKDRESNFEKLQIKSMYEKRLSNSKEESDKKLSKTVEHYEDIISRERDENMRKFNSKVSELQADYKKLYQANELEKETMRVQFDNRIEELRQANMAALEERSQERKAEMNGKA